MRSACKVASFKTDVWGAIPLALPFWGHSAVQLTRRKRNILEFEILWSNWKDFIL